MPTLFRPARFLLTLAVCSGLFACKLGNRESLVNKRSEYQVLAPDSVLVERVGDGTSTQIRFVTKVAAFCEIFFYSQDPGGTPAESNPTRLPCSKESEVRSEFNETVTGLAPEILYNYGIYVWSQDSARDKGEAIVVRERPDNSGAVRLKDGSWTEILVARFNAPLRTAAIQRIGLDPPLKADVIVSKSAPKNGCSPWLDQPHWTSRANLLGIGLSSFATRGFATAEGVASEKRITTVFNTLQFGNPEWEWTYQTPVQSNVLVKLRPPGKLTAVEIWQSQRTTLPEVKLSESDATVKLEGGMPLNISWQWDNLPSNAYLNVTIGRIGDIGAVRCTFDPKSGRGSVPAESLSALQTGKHQLQVELESISFQAVSGWLARAIDWRGLRIEKS
jgi:hypothetical protein